MEPTLERFESAADAGVYFFTNPTNKERKYLWNNKEYTFPAESSVPLIISNEPLESIQEIRKRFAFHMALERLYEGEKVRNADGVVVFDYTKAKEMGNGLPPTFDEKILEPFIHECLKPLQVKRVIVKKVETKEERFKATKAVGKNENLNEIFKEETIPELGEMPDR